MHHLTMYTYTNDKDIYVYIYIYVCVYRESPLYMYVFMYDWICFTNYTENFWKSL